MTGPTRDVEADPLRVATKRDFARELTLAKETAGVSVRDIATAIGVPASTVGGYFSGKHLPGLRPAGQLARILAVCGITDPAAVERWRVALRRARSAVGEPASPTSQVDGPVGAWHAPVSAAVPPPQAQRALLVSTRPPVDRLTQGPTLRGRDDLIARMDRLLDGLARPARANGPHLLVLHGLGGSGKTTVALAVAGRALDRGYPVWWITGSDPETLTAGMQALAAELGAGPDELRLGSPLDLVWRRLAEHPGPWILVLDNVDDPLGTLALPGAAITDGNGWVRSIGGGRGLTLVTGRDGRAATWGDPPPAWIELIAVRPLDPQDGALVLTELAGPSAGSTGAARQLASRLGGLPLALCLAGRHIAEAAGTPAVFAGPDETPTFEGYGRALDQGHHRQLFGEGGESARPPWELSLDLLADRGLPLARPLLRLLSCLGPAPVPCGLLLRPATLSASPLFGTVTGRQIWEGLRALAGLGIVDLARVAHADPDLADVVVPHQLVREFSRHSADVRANGAAYLALVTAVIESVAGELDPKDPRTWGRWRALIAHSGNPLDLVPELRLSPRAVPPGVLRAATLSGRFLRAAGELARAEAAYSRVLRLSVAVAGARAPGVLEIQHDLARVWYDLGRLGDAIGGLRAVLKARSRVLGPTHPDTLTTQHYLARALRDGGQLDAAWRLLRKTLDARRAELGDAHPDTLTSRNNAADALRALGHHDRAAAELDAVLQERIRILGAEHPATLVCRYNLARLAHDRDDLAGAGDQLRSLVDTYERVLGAEHPRTLLTRQAQIDVWHDMGECERALGAARELLRRRASLLGPRHPATLATRHRIGLLLIDLGAHAEAEEELAAVLADRRLVLGPRHPDTELVRESLNALRSRRGSGGLTNPS